MTRTVELFTRVLRRDSAKSGDVYVRFFQVVEWLVEHEPTLSTAEQVAQIRTALAAAEALLSEIWAAER